MAALIVGPLVDFGVFAYFIRADGPCSGEGCYDQYALGLIALITFGAWLLGAGVGYLIRVIVYPRPSANAAEVRDASSST